MARNRVARPLALLASMLSCLCLSAHAQTDPWIPADPTRVVPRQLAAFSCSSQTTVNSRWVFSDSGYRVFQPPVVSRSGQTISLDARVEESTGIRLPALNPFQKNFDIGLLEPGPYTLDFKSWDTTLQQIQFTVAETPPAPQPIGSPCFFVAQHYSDFLSREGDGSGFAFWNNEISQCALNEHYFGSLRRDPDTTGFQFWLDKLIQFDGNFVEAEMVKAFISSDEYRQRF